MNLTSTYFYTATILNWVRLLEDNDLKAMILESLSYLVSKKKIRVYGFVIMPNHIHLIWRNLEKNGKELPHESFMKFTAHEFKKQVDKTKSHSDQFIVNKVDRKYQFWQREALPVEILSREMLEQKLEYLHLNPLQAHWNLVDDPKNYKFSSCSFYERNDLQFNWLTDYREDF